MSLFIFPTTTLPITITVIKNDGSLWTWGYNSLGTCGILSGDYLIDLPADQAAADITNGNFIASPTKVMDNAKMVLPIVQFKSEHFKFFFISSALI
ncbi:MAG: hypothetical protein MR922_08805 [Lachnospiraceae bacterium]|nr:hypothetical protein [Lachnospiraceae bacterium]